MKKRYLGLLLLPLMIAACSGQAGGNSIPDYSYDSHTINHERKTGEIAAFDLIAPNDGLVVEGSCTFTWGASNNNADYFILEIASTNTFVTDDIDEVYVRESNITQNSFYLNYSLPKKDILYYWRVTAVNKDHSKQANDIANFYYKAPEVGEIPIKIEDEQDWVLHKEGSYADISIDRSDFFGTGNDSLAIVFDKEHTLQEPFEEHVSSNGWIVITKNEDRELYGTDAFYFNFYYSGHDANVLVRVLDYDGEYWHKQIQIANNSKQTILVKYEEFELRTAGTNIFNRKFDWEHIRYFEIVFERTFGDGICLFSNIKAVKFDSYKNMFVEKMDFRSTDMKDWTFENFNFEKTISENGDEITLTYDTAKGFSGYGFQNINVYKYFVQGDAIRMKVKYTGTGNNANFYFRILEEDNDRWQFKTPFTYFTRDEYKELVIPLKAFQRTDYMTGDGAKQFYYIQKFNVGLADNYTSGTISIKDLEVIKIRDILPEDAQIVESNGLSRRVVPNTGCIDDFNNYSIYTEMYYSWEQSVVNKDEAMKLDTLHKNGGIDNPYCAEFDYKADMEMATYQIYMDTTAVQDKNAFSIWLKDASVKPDDAAVSYLKDDDVAAEMTIQLTMDSGEWYRFIIDKVNKEWHKYTICFSDFFLQNGDTLFDNPIPLSSNHIIHMAFGFKYFYYDESGKSHPTYAIANPVYIDEIYLTNASSSSVEELSGTISEDKDGSGRATIETMENYQSTAEIFGYWSYGNNMEYNSIELSNVVSSQGGNHSIKMHYKGANSVSYARKTPFARNIQARGVCLDIKGDGKATVYLNLNWRVSASTLLKMRYAITNIPTTWTRYELGFDLFKDIAGSTNTIGLNDAKAIESISFGIVNSDNSDSDIYVDNLRLLKEIDYEDRIVTPINQEELKMKFEKYKNNPILKPNPQNQWEELCVLNPAAVYNEEDQTFYMVYRAAGNDKTHIIHLGLATSKDGINFTRVSDKPLLSGDPNGLDAGGCEDPRLVKMGDYFYLTYASRPFPPGQYWREDKEYFGFQPEYGPKVLVYNNTLTHLAISKDLRNWKKLGPMTDSHFDDRDVILFPETINGKFYMLSRAMERCGEGYPNKNPAIWLSSSDDLLHWDNYKLLMQGETDWEDKKIGAGTPPIKTKDGWLVLYHGVSTKDDAYRVGAILLDLNDPFKILARTKDFLMEPAEPYETNGYYNGCVFPTAVVDKDGKLFIYYGAGDKVVCLATCDKEALLKYLKEECRV